MGRRPDPEVQKKRLKAARLERKKGLNATQIGKRMGAPASTVKRWLREIRGPRRPVREEDVLAGLEQRKSLGEIAKELGVTHRRIRQILEEAGRYEPGPYVRVAERVPAFVEDPELHKGAYWTVTESFAYELNFYCKTLVNHDPRGSGGVLKIALDHFSALLELRKSEKAKRATRCQLVQAKANQAARHRSLDAPGKALELLAEARDTSEGCPACEADLSRREAAALNDLRRLPEALAKVRKARDYYRGNEGHDPNKNGAATSALVECWTHIYGENHSAAISLAETAVDSISPKKHQDLYIMLWYALAYALFKRRAPGDVARASDLCDRHVERIDQGEASQNRARLYWFRAKIFEIQGDVQAAINLLGAALDDVRELKLPAGMAAIGADFGRLKGDPDAFRAYLEDFKEWPWDQEDKAEDDHQEEQEGEKQERVEKRERWEKSLPEWLGPLRDVLERAKSQALTDLHSAVRILRTEGKGNEFMPQIS